MMARMRSIRVLVALVLLAGVACGGDDETTPEPLATPAPSPTVEESQTSAPSPTATGFACPNQEEALTHVGEDGRSLRGDVDGDGSDDTVSIVVDLSGEPGCLAFIVIESADGVNSAPIDQEGLSTDVGFPALVSLVNIDGEPGVDVLMNMVAGASTQFAGVFTAPGGVPTRLRFEQPTEFGDLFPTGGSVGHLEASDCIGPGAIIISTATPKADDYKVTRTAYVVVDGELSPQEEGVETVRIPLERLDRFPEFQASPFGSCPPD
jgi:hypothetical protein